MIYWAKCFGVFFLHSTSCCQLSPSGWSLQQRSWMEANKAHKIYLFPWRIRDEALQKPFSGTSRLLLPRRQAVSQHAFSKMIVSVFLLTKLPGRSTRVQVKLSSSRDGSVDRFHLPFALIYSYSSHAIYFCPFEPVFSFFTN